MDGVANMADAMLVLALGIMLSLIIHWNVDVGGERAHVDITRGRQVSQIEGAENKAEEMLKDDGTYEKMGTVYKDPATGKLFLMTEEEQAGKTD
jgi:hypothetical protein